MQTGKKQKNNAAPRLLTDVQKAEIVSLVEGYIDLSSGNKLASASGISSSYISQMRNKEWEKISDAMWIKIKTFITGSDWQTLQNTESMTAMYAACDDAREKQRMVSVSAYTGAGKTAALKFYRADNSDTTHYIACNFLMKPKDLLHEIAKCFNIETTSRDMDIITKIGRKVETVEHSGSLILLDDFAKLSDGCYRMLQLVYDTTEYKLGIVVTGTETLSEYVQRAAKRNKMGFREIQRRLGVMRSLPLPSKQDIEDICDINGLKDQTIIKQIIKSGVSDYGTLKQMVMDSI